MEIENPVITKQVDYICDACGEGKMRPNGVSLLCSPAKFPHICNSPNCSEMQNFKCTYPKIIYVVGEDAQ